MKNSNVSSNYEHSEMPLSDLQGAIGQNGSVFFTGWISWQDTKTSYDLESTRSTHAFVCFLATIEDTQKKEIH